MKHDWYWADIKFREPQLKQEAVPPPTFVVGAWGVVDQPYLPASSPNTKSAGIETAIKELKDLFCNSFKRK